MSNAPIEVEFEDDAPKAPPPVKIKRLVRQTRPQQYVEDEPEEPRKHGFTWYAVFLTVISLGAWFGYSLYNGIKGRLNRREEELKLEQERIVKEVEEHRLAQEKLSKLEEEKKRLEAEKEEAVKRQKEAEDKRVFVVNASTEAIPPPEPEWKATQRKLIAEQQAEFFKNLNIGSSKDERFYR